MHINTSHPPLSRSSSITYAHVSTSSQNTVQLIFESSQGSSNQIPTSKSSSDLLSFRFRFYKSICDARFAVHMSSLPCHRLRYKKRDLGSHARHDYSHLSYLHHSVTRPQKSGINHGVDTKSSVPLEAVCNCQPERSKDELGKDQHARNIPLIYIVELDV